MLSRSDRHHPSDKRWAKCETSIELPSWGTNLRLTERLQITAAAGHCVDAARRTGLCAVMGLTSLFEYTNASDAHARIGSTDRPQRFGLRRRFTLERPSEARSALCGSFGA